MNRPDDTILDHIWRSLWNEETIRTIDIQDISVVVETGQACLSGHVSKDDHNRRIEEIARSIPGVMAVHNHLVTDHDLRNQVAQALGKNDSTRPFTLRVTCLHGWVELDGLVPNREIQRNVEETAASVADVRGVILLPIIKGENPPPVRDAVQPRIGVKVVGEDKNDGTVYQVVVNPQNRLVTHAVVRINHFANGWRNSCDYLVPVEAMDMVGVNGILLNGSTSAIPQFPGFTPADYPFAPLTWQPPFPYPAGSVRWPRLEKAKAEQRSTVKSWKS